ECGKCGSRGATDFGSGPVLGGAQQPAGQPRRTDSEGGPVETGPPSGLHRPVEYGRRSPRARRTPGSAEELSVAEQRGLRVAQDSALVVRVELVQDDLRDVLAVRQAHVLGLVDPAHVLDRDVVDRGAGPGLDLTLFVRG